MIVKIKRHSNNFLKKTPVGDNKKELDTFLKQKIDESKVFGQGVPLLSQKPFENKTDYMDKLLIFSRELVLGFIIDIDSDFVTVNILDHKSNIISNYKDYYACSCILSSYKDKKFIETDKLLYFFLDNINESSSNN